MNSAPDTTIIQWLTDGSDPSGGYCRICGRFAVPRFEGHWANGVCDTVCFDELQWREALRIMRQPYRRPEV